MPVVPFGEYRPDISDYEASSERDALNVVPRADGYGPFPSLAAISISLGAQCRGAFQALNNGVVVVFAATATDLFLMSNTNYSWSKVSLGGGPYTTISNSDQWEFRQFNNLVIAVQANVVPQVFDVTSSTAFAALAGSPPQARYIDVVSGVFVVLSGLLSNPNRVQWSGLNDVNGSTSWTAGINSSDFQDLSDGGECRGVAGSQAGGLIMQDTCIRAMIYLPGSPVIFQIEKIADGIGIYGPYSLIRKSSTVFFYSLQGFQRVDPGGVPVPIGRERVDRTFFANLDVNNLQMFQGVSDPRSSRIMWAYKSIAGAANQFDSILCYDPVLDKFTPLGISGECLLQMSQPGTTLEGIDYIAPNNMAVVGAANNGSGKVRIQVASTALLTTGQYVAIQAVVGTTEANGDWFITVVDATHFDLIGSTYVHSYVSGGEVGGQLDLLEGSLDNYTTVIVPQLAAFDVNHSLNVFTGPSLQATLETAEQGTTTGQRIKLKKGFRPITDAATVYGSASMRENLQAAVTAGAESLISAITGVCYFLLDTRYSRFKVRIPAGTAWTFINGVEPLDLTGTGKR